MQNQNLLLSYFLQTVQGSQQIKVPYSLENHYFSQFFFIQCMLSSLVKSELAQ